MSNMSQLVGYIQHALMQGESEEGIRNNLRQHGWAESAVDEAFTHAYGLIPVPPTATSTSIPRKNDQRESDKSLVTAWLLSFFLGGLGIDRFYLGLIGTGLLKLVTSGGLGIWVVIDLVRIGFGIQKDKHKHTLASTPKSRKIIRILTVVFITLCIVGIVGVFLLTFLSAPSLQKNAQNTQRRVDASSIASAIAEYTASHNGVLPQSVQAGATASELLVCGTSCSDNNQVSAHLGYYANTPVAISIKAYSPGLKVPDVDTLYIVNDAGCSAAAPDASSEAGIGAQSPGAAAILFATLTGSADIEQHCTSI
jgi:type II secretory pathway pseudopilin PulG